MIHDFKQKEESLIEILQCKTLLKIISKNKIKVYIKNKESKCKILLIEENKVSYIWIQIFRYFCKSKDLKIAEKLNIVP